MEGIDKEILDEIEPRHIDETLYKMLEDGTKELSNKLFFELILENPAYLSTRLFQKNVLLWQYQLGNPLFTKEKQKEAKRNLINIGRTLAHEDKGRPKMIDEIFIIDRYKKLVQLLKKYFHGDMDAKRDLALIRNTLKKENKRVNVDGKRSPHETAIIIIEAYYSISHRKIEVILKKNAVKKSK
jgi:hypothetical protein